MAKLFKKLTKSGTELKYDFIKQLLSLATSGFGLVAALAWNNFIQEIVKLYIQPLTGKFSGLISQLVYAIVVTLLAVFITYNLTKISEKR